MLIAVDTEYNSETNELYAIQTYNGDKCGYFLASQIKQARKYLLDNPLWVFHSSPSDVPKIFDTPVPRHVQVYDTMTLIRYVSEDEPRGLKHLASKYLGKEIYNLATLRTPRIKDEDEFSKFVIDTITPKTLEYRSVVDFVNRWRRINKVGEVVNNYSTIPLRLAKYYALHDVHSTYHLAKKLIRMIPNDSLELLMNVEVPVNRVMLNASIMGIRQDQAVMAELVNHLETSLEDVGNKIRNSGIDVNTSSNKELGQALAALGLGLEISKAGNYILNSKALKDINLEVTNLLLEERGLKKLLTTYTEFTPVAHPQFDTVGAKSSRMSSRSVNFQNLPTNTNFDVRRAYIPLDGYVFVGADFSSQEAVVTAEYSQDPLLLAAVTQDVDIHTMLARKINPDVDPELDDYTWSKKHKSTLRQEAKTTTYAMLYGGTKSTLINNQGYTVEQATKVEASFKDLYSTLFKWRSSCFKRFCKEGKIRYNRVPYYRHLPEGFDFMSDGFASLRNSVLNSLVQGDCAFITKQAILDIDKYIADNNMDAWVSLAVHDAIYLQCRPQDAEKLLEALKAVMRVKIVNLTLDSDGAISTSLSKTVSV